MPARRRKAQPRTRAHGKNKRKKATSKRPKPGQRKKPSRKSALGRSLGPFVEGAKKAAGYVAGAAITTAAIGKMKELFKKPDDT